MKVISYTDIIRLNIPVTDCYQWVEEMIREKSSALLQPKISMKPREDVFCNVMPGIIRSADGLRGGVKIVTRYPSRAPGLDSKLLLFDAENGEFLALMDANWITAMRTGAVAAHSIRLFAKKDFRRIGMMGLGNTARAVMLFLAELMPERELEVSLLRYKGQEKLFAERFAQYQNLRFHFVEKPEDIIRGSDVAVSAVTYLPDDICSDACFPEGILVVPVHTRGFTNCDLFFDKVYADDYGHVCHFKNFDRFRSFAEVSDVVNKRAPGRENDRERILAYNIGISLHDINLASHIYQSADLEKLPDIDLQEPAEKFWI